AAGAAGDRAPLRADRERGAAPPEQAAPLDGVDQVGAGERQRAQAPLVVGQRLRARAGIGAVEQVHLGISLWTVVRKRARASAIRSRRGPARRPASAASTAPAQSTSIASIQPEVPSVPAPMPCTSATGHAA